MEYLALLKIRVRIKFILFSIFFFLILKDNLYFAENPLKEKIKLLPQVKEIEWKEKVFEINTKYAVIFAEKEEVNSPTLKKCKEFLKSIGIVRVDVTDNFEKIKNYPTVIVLKRLEKKEAIPDTNYISFSQGYTLSISKEGNSLIIKLSGVEKIGTFYALQTFKQLVVIEKDKIYLPEVFIRDKPSFPVRGVIEGGGGNWSFPERMRMIDFFASVKFNIYLYAPKGDKKLRDEWRRPYTKEEIENFQNLIRKCEENFIIFSVIFSPALSFNFADEEDFKRLLKKYESMYNLGCRHFGIFFDDILPALGTPQENKMFSHPAEAHVYLANRLYNALKKKNPEIIFSFCPTPYWGITPSRYLEIVKEKLNKEIYVGWTGIDVCSREIRTEEAKKFKELVGGKIAIGDNFPVHGGGIATGPVRDRDRDLYLYVDSFLSNPLWRNPEISKISLSTIADYTWSPENYDPDKSWENSLRIFAGDTLYPVMRTFAEQYQAAWAVRARPSKISVLFEKFYQSYIEGKEVEQIEKDLREELQNLLRCRSVLREEFDNIYFLKEADEYLKECENYAKGAIQILDLIKNFEKPQEKSKREKIVNKMKEILSTISPEIQSGKRDVFKDLWGE